MQNVVSRTPLRITFSGGGSDMPWFYKVDSPGAVLNASINKYIYIFLHRSFDDKFRIRYSDNEEVDNIDDIKHNTTREALKLLGIDEPIEIVSLADVTSKGAGLGSSSAHAVGLLNALHAFKGEHASKEQLAKEAIYLERDVLKLESGKQDAYIASFGGINLFEFYKDETVRVKPVVMEDRAYKKPTDIWTNVEVEFKQCVHQKHKVNIKTHNSTEIDARGTNHNDKIITGRIAPEFAQIIAEKILSFNETK